MVRNFIVPHSVVHDKERWRKVAQKAMEAEWEIEMAYAHTGGEEAEIAIEMMLKELFGIDLSLSEDEEDKVG
ncbi:hypothetical protein LCGC14_1414870 [marine sediment metagenome]|uniref:Uncharacterized protein n=1 Tax=marine sediment metagenome TaxID=412755 RepID=A0A0F9JTI4_9ZZZZ